MPTLSEVARAAGVSITTASRVLNKGMHANRVSEACAARVRETARQLGYSLNYHARSIRTGKAETIGVAIDIGDPEIGKYGTHAPLADSYFGGLAGGIELETRRCNYRMTLIGADTKLRAPDRGLLEIRQRRLDGLIVFGTVVRDDKTRFMSQLHDAPVVVIQYPGQTPLPVIHFDEATGIRLAIQHLAQLGHRHVLWLGPAVDGRLSAPSAREQHFIAAMWDAGLRGASCRFRATAQQRANDVQDNPGVIADLASQALERYLASHSHRKFTAILCNNDFTALGAYGALAQAGLKIPHDVSVIGFDDVQASTAYPRMTTVNHKLNEMGQAATALLMKMIADPAHRKAMVGVRHTITPDLVIRHSTAPARTIG